jgi:hypothetical protein
MHAFLSPALCAGCSPKASGNNTDGIPKRRSLLLAALPEVLLRADKKHFQCFLSGISINKNVSYGDLHNE